MRTWKLPRRSIPFGDRTIIMGVLNVTPDSFSDGGDFFTIERAIARAEEMIGEGADIIDIGGESTRPGGHVVPAGEEQNRVLPVIEKLAKTAAVPISIDTTKSLVARAATDAGAEIINDISGLRFDPALASVARDSGAGLVLMHSRGAPGQLHDLDPVRNILEEVVEGLSRSIQVAVEHGVERERLALDPGIGFGKSAEQNIELVANLELIARAFSDFPLLVGTSRKSFIGRLLDDSTRPKDRLFGTMATVVASILGGAHIIRVHDVRAGVETARVADAIKTQRKF